MDKFNILIASSSWSRGASVALSVFLMPITKFSHGFNTNASLSVKETKN